MDSKNGLYIIVVTAIYLVVRRGISLDVFMDYVHLVLFICLPLIAMGTALYLGMLLIGYTEHREEQRRGGN
jgi:hypothetical protein